jgi:cytochrome P450
VAQIRSEPATRPTSALEALAASQPQMAEDRTVLLNLFYMWQTASADVAGMLHWCIACLGSSPHWRERLQEACQGEGVPPLARAIVQETLRMEQSEYLMREVQQEFRHAGFRFPAGYLLRVCVRESHRLDPAVADADSFNPGRFLDGGLSRQHFSPFGTGATSCPGEPLALLIGSIFLTELSRRYRWEATSSGAPEFGGFHWRPGPRCRLRATARGSLDAGPGPAGIEAPDGDGVAHAR